MRGARSIRSHRLEVGAVSGFFHELTPLQRFALFAILVTFGCSLTLLWSSTDLLGNMIGAALSLGALCLAVIVTLRKEESANRVRRYSLYVGLAISLAALAPPPLQLWVASTL